MHPATALDIKTREADYIKDPKFKYIILWSLKSDKENQGVKEVDCMQMQKILFLKVENKLVMRYRAFSFTNQNYTKDPIGVNKMFTI